MTIPFRVKLLTDTAKAPERANEGDLWDLFTDGFCAENLQDIDQDDAMYNYHIVHKENLNFEHHLDCFDRNHLPGGLPAECKIYPKGRILVKTGIALELPALYHDDYIDCDGQPKTSWAFRNELRNHSGIIQSKGIYSYAVADLRPRSGLALKYGITVLNSPATIDNSYRKEIGVILVNHGHAPITINKGDKIAQMLIRPLYPSKMEVVDNIEDTGRGNYGSTGK